MTDGNSLSVATLLAEKHFSRSQELAANWIKQVALGYVWMLWGQFVRICIK